MGWRGGGGGGGGALQNLHDPEIVTICLLDFTTKQPSQTASLILPYIVELSNRYTNQGVHLVWSLRVTGLLLLM